MVVAMMNAVMEVVVDMTVGGTKGFKKFMAFPGEDSDSICHAPQGKGQEGVYCFALSLIFILTQMLKIEVKKICYLVSILSFVFHWK